MVLLTYEVLGPRLFYLQGPPRGTHLRILRARLGRSKNSGRRKLSLPASEEPVLSPSSPSYKPLGRFPISDSQSQSLPQRAAFSASDGMSSFRYSSQPPLPLLAAASPSNIQDELFLLRQMLLATPPKAAPPSPVQPPVSTTLAAASSDGWHALDRRTENLFQYLQTNDTRHLYRWIVPASGGDATRSSTDTAAREEHMRRCGLAANLPPVMFSEFLRCLDPFVVNRYCDYASDFAISPGLAQFTPLRAQVNRFGIRLIYIALLKALVSVYTARVEARRGFLLQDYIVLMRCAGAASDMDTAKRFWHDMEGAGYVTWRQSDVYLEFIKARFLTESLYAQNDPFRLRVQPVNLHKQKLMLYPTRLHRLDRLRRALERYKVQRFGQNPNEPDYAEHLTRILRKTKPARNVFAKVSILGYVQDERVLAAIMVALGRTGSVAALTKILANHWKVRVVWDKASGRVTVGGGAHFAPDSPMRPSASLLDAVVQAYCCNGEVACALQVVDHLSRRYGVAIPSRTWFDLLSWTYVMTSKPACTEWKWAGFPSRVLKPGTTELIWKTMTSEPYNVQPGFAQYHILIKTYIQQRKVDAALALMRQAKHIYQAQLGEYEDAMLEYAESMRQRMDTGAASKRFHQAANRKWYMWYCFRTWCWHILKRIKPRGLDDPVVVRTVPDLLAEFQPFIPTVAQYRTAAGMVQIREPYQHPKHTTVRQTVDLPALRPHVSFQHRTIDTSPGCVTGGGDGGMNALVGSPETVDKGEKQHANIINIGEEEKWLERRLIHGVLRRRSMWLREAMRSTPNLRALGRTTPRDWLVQEFA